MHQITDSEYTKENLIEAKMLFGDFNTPLYIIKRTSKHNINKNVEALNKVINQLELSDSYRMFHPMTVEHTFSSTVWMNYFQACEFFPNVCMKYSPQWIMFCAMKQIWKEPNR